MLDAGEQLVGALAQVVKTFYESDLKVVGVLRAVVGEPPFHEAPDALVGIQLGCVAREVLKMKPSMTGLELGESLAPVDGSPVEKDDDGAAQVAQQMPEEAAHVQQFDVVLVESVVQAEALTLWADRDGGYGGHPVAPEAMHNKRCPAAGGPGPDNGGQHQEAGFVEEDDMGAQPRGVFFTDAQRVRFQRLIATSSRSLARRSGFWWVQPNCFISRPM